MRFTESIQRHVQCPTREIAGATLRDVLEGYWVSENGGDSWQTISANLPPVYAVRFEKES